MKAAGSKGVRRHELGKFVGRRPDELEALDVAGVRRELSPDSRGTSIECRLCLVVK